MLIGQFGMALGELFWTEDLATDARMKASEPSAHYSASEAGPVGFTRTPSTNSMRRFSIVFAMASGSAYSSEPYHRWSCSIVSNSTITTRCLAGQSPSGTTGSAPRTRYRPPYRAIEALASSR